MAEWRARRPCPVCPACAGGRWSQGWRDSEWRLLVCRGCGLGRLWPHPARERLESVYDERYFRDHYLASRAARLAHFRSLWASLEGLDPALAPGRPGAEAKRLLDVGCGPGFFLEVASERGWEAWGVEPSVAADYVVRHLRERVIRRAFGDEHLPSASFDVVTFWDVLAHLPQPESALARAAQLVRGGGLLVVKTPARNRAVLAAARLLGPYGRALLHLPQQVYHFTPAALRALGRVAGFEEIRLVRTTEARRAVPPATRLRQTLARQALAWLERVLSPRPSLLLLSRRAPRPDETLRAAEA